MSLPTSQAVANGSAPNVLIVEDDAATRRLYKFLLTNGGYPVLEAEDGVAALEQLALHQCDLVITDMNMPRMDGMDLIRAIRRDYNDIYVILITAFGTPDTEKQAMKIGAVPISTHSITFARMRIASATAMNTPAPTMMRTPIMLGRTEK